MNAEHIGVGARRPGASRATALNGVAAAGPGSCVEGRPPDWYTSA